MGFISQYAQTKGLDRQSTRTAAFPGQNEGRAKWDQIFSTNKEAGGRVDDSTRQIPVRGGSYGRSSATGEAATKRLLQALRSMAPGGWSDDRWEQVRHFVGIAYIAIHRLATQMQRSEFQVYRKDRNHPDGKIAVTEDDTEAWKLVKLLEKPNGQDSWGKLMYRWIQQKYLTGTALTWMVPNMLRQPYELYCIPTPLAIPQPAINPDYPDGFYRIQPVYPYGPFSSYPTPASAVGAPVPAQWMLRFQFPHPLLRYEGWSPLTALKLHLDEVESIDQSRWYKMKKSLNPSAVFNMSEMDGMVQLPEPEIDRMHAEWDAFLGPSNHGGLLIGSPGGKLEEFGQRAIDMDYPAGWDQLVSFALAGFGITKPVAGMIEDSSYATLFASLKQVYELTLSPDCEDIGADLTRHVAPFFGDDLIVEIRCKRIDDHDIALAKVGVMLQGRLGTVNEARKLLDLPAVDATKFEWGEERLGEPPMQAMVDPNTGMPIQGGDLNAMAGAVPQQGEEQSGMTMPEFDPESDLMPGELDENLIKTTQPTPGNLGRGALGPRKYMNGHNNRINGHVKALRNKYKRNGVLLNGSH